jgi:hypothetical protein
VMQRHLSVNHQTAAGPPITWASSSRP